MVRRVKTMMTNTFKLFYSVVINVLSQWVTFISGHMY
jgi:hypothetical protein